jgi:hypothetical protein
MTSHGGLAEKEQIETEFSLDFLISFAALALLVMAFIR